MRSCRTSACVRTASRRKPGRAGLGPDCHELLDGWISPHHALRIGRSAPGIFSLASLEPVDCFAERPRPLRRRQAGKALRQFTADLEMLVVDRIVPIAAPDQEAL